MIINTAIVSNTHRVKILELLAECKPLEWDGREEGVETLAEGQTAGVGDSGEQSLAVVWSSGAWGRQNHLEEGAGLVDHLCNLGGVEGRLSQLSLLWKHLSGGEVGTSRQASKVSFDFAHRNPCCLYKYALCNVRVSEKAQNCHFKQHAFQVYMYTQSTTNCTDQICSSLPKQGKWIWTWRMSWGGRERPWQWRTGSGCEWLCHHDTGSATPNPIAGELPSDHSVSMYIYTYIKPCTACPSPPLPNINRGS